MNARCSFAAFDHDGVADEISRAVEQAIRTRFKLTGAEYDLSFTDMIRAIEQILAGRLGGALDCAAAVDAILDEFTDDGGDDDQ